MTDIVRMYDGIAGDAASIAKAFPGAEMVAGYVDGRFVWMQNDWDLFPKAQHILVSAIPGSSTAMTADVADCEDGDYDAAQAAAWARAKIKDGYYRPTIYCSLDVAVAVRDATGSLILGVDYDLWIADYDGMPTQVVFPDGRKAALKQYNDFNFYDISAVFDSAWPHRKDPKKPVPPNHVPRPSSPQVVTTGGNEGLGDFAHYHSMTVQEVIYLTAVQKAGHGFGTDQGAYISGGNWNDNMPKGSTWWIGPTP